MAPKRQFLRARPNALAKLNLILVRVYRDLVGTSYPETSQINEKNGQGVARASRAKIINVITSDLACN